MREEIKLIQVLKVFCQLAFASSTILKVINYSYGYKPIGVPQFGQLDAS